MSWHLSNGVDWLNWTANDSEDVRADQLGSSHRQLQSSSHARCRLSFWFKGPDRRLQALLFIGQLGFPFLA